MAAREPLKTVSVERLSGGVHITFSNGREGLFSDEFLAAGLPKAERRLARELRDNEKAIKLAATPKE